LAFAVYLLIYIGLIPIQLSHWLSKYGIWLITVVFSLRAVGDFKYIGFFKKVKGTDFANRDTLFYSPICIVIAGISIMILGK